MRMQGTFKKSDLEVAVRVHGQKSEDHLKYEDCGENLRGDQRPGLGYKAASGLIQVI